MDEGYKHFGEGSQDNEGYVNFNTLDGGGCSTKIPINNRYNVLKYYSDFRAYRFNDEDSPAYPACSPASNRSSGVLSDGYNILDWRTNWSIRNMDTGDKNFSYNRFLNISNMREVTVNSTAADLCRNSIMSIDTTDENRDADVNGDYVFKLYEKSVAKTIVNTTAGTSDTETVDSMEFMFFHSKIERCQDGKLYLEIEDFDLSGWTNDNTLYCYYWEGSKADDQTTLDQLLAGERAHASSEFVGLGTENRCVQAMRLSDVVGGSGNKLIVGCNRTITNTEEVYVNLLIGLKPSDVSYSDDFASSDTGDISTGAYSPTTFDEVGAPVFKYKKANFKLMVTTDDWNNKPSFYPTEGLIGYPFISTTSDVHTINAYNQFTDLNDLGVNTVGASGEYTEFKMGISNGGQIGHTSPDLAFAKPSEKTGVFVGGFSPEVSLSANGSMTLKMNIGVLSKIPSTIKDDVYKFVMPRCYCAMGGQSDVDFNNPTDASTYDLRVNLYAGDEAGVQNELVKFHDLSDSMTLIKSWTLSAFYSQFRLPYNKDEDDFIITTPINAGYPIYKFPTTDQKNVDVSKVVDIDITALKAAGTLGGGTIVIYIAIETATAGIKNGRAGFTSALTSSDPSNPIDSGAWSRTDDSGSSLTQHGILAFKQMYTSGSSGGSQVGKIGHCGSFLYKPPQIINKNQDPVAENYYE